VHNSLFTHLWLVVPSGESDLFSWCFCVKTVFRAVFAGFAVGLVDASVYGVFVVLGVFLFFSLCVVVAFCRAPQECSRWRLLFGFALFFFVC
jgi:hypothetical protein